MSWAAQASLELIECALDCDHDDVAQCGHFQAMVADRIGLDSPAHVGVVRTPQDAGVC